MMDALKTAIGWLAARCDGALTCDGAGFSGVDVAIGHALAGKAIWSIRETHAATRLAVKYQKQLQSGSMAVEGVDALRNALAQQVGEKPPIRERDVVDGRIYVDLQAQCIVLKTRYHKEIRARARELIGAEWNGDRQEWRCLLCAENAADVEELAQQFGLKQPEHAKWDELPRIQRVERVGDRLLVHGVNARRIIEALPEQKGQPDIDEQLFRAIERYDDTTIAIPLRSWTIRESLLWLVALQPGDAQHGRLGWAIDEMTRLLGTAYPDALRAEQAAYARAAATTLDADAIAPLRARLPADVADRLMPHQWIAVAALTAHAQVFLADEQGLGKTIEILASLEAASAFPAIVLAPATALLNWRDEAADWLPQRKVAVRGGGVGKRDEGAALEQADIVIINYDSFGKHAAALQDVRPKALVADEAQYLKGHNSKRTEAVKDFSRNSGVARVIASTGTPIMNRPSELLTLLTLLPDLLLDLGGFLYFAARYCRATLCRGSLQPYWDYDGAANLGELANRLRESGRFVRRDKAAVLPDLPPKRREEIAVELCNRAEYDLAATDFANWLKTRNPSTSSSKARAARQEAVTADDDESGLEATAAWLLDGEDVYFDAYSRAEALRKLGALRQLVGKGKIPAAIQQITDIVKDEKLVVFAYHIEVQEALERAMAEAGLRPLAITGSMDIKPRRDAIRRFQDNADARVIVCSLKAAQTAITLTAACRVLMVEFDWVPSALEQAEDRVHRIGQSEQVLVQFLHAPGTLDERMAELLQSKRETIRAVNAADAPYGYRADGTPRRQPAGPGRPRLDPVERKRRRKASKAGWQECNPEYMRDYMRKRRRQAQIESAEQALREATRLERLGHSGMQRRLGGNAQWYRPEDFEAELAQARTKADKACATLKKLGVDVKDVKP
ncbi:MAG: DEAD/DEAH box helicase [Burkholderiales bacterium]|nr:DEAD/DEAH box helicase [Burkholderiales bacterium]